VRDFTFRDNLVYNTGGGVVTNGGSNGVIANNLVEATHSNGIGSGWSAGQLVIDRNVVRGSHNQSFFLSSDGDGVSLTRNVTLDSCPGGSGGDVLIHAHGLYGSGSGLELTGNVFNGGTCRGTLTIIGRRDIRMEDTIVRRGTSASMMLLDVQRMTINNSLIEGPTPLGLMIHVDVHDLSGRLAIQDATRPVAIVDPSRTSNITLEY
jgi:hypothetical protein